MGAYSSATRQRRWSPRNTLYVIFLSTQQAKEEGDLENAYWLPGTENDADGSTKVRSEMVPLLRLLESGGLCLGQHRALKGVAWKGYGVHVTHSNSISHVHVQGVDPVLGG